MAVCENRTKPLDFRKLEIAEFFTGFTELRVSSRITLGIGPHHSYAPQTDIDAVRLGVTIYVRSLLVGLTMAIVVALAPHSAIAAGTRVALIIGNSAYRNVARLPNPERDASAVAKLLRDAGFNTVVEANNVGNLDFKRAIRKFEDSAFDADIAVVYYAGHGIEVGGINYLVPIDARLASDRDAEDEAISLNRLVESVDGAKRLRLIILDACRDDPFVATMKRVRRTVMRSISSGLGKVEPTGTDTLIAYAAKAGSTAEDGDGAHSPFTTALLDNLTVPGLDIRLAFGRVRDEVLKITGRRQEPFVYGSLGGGNISLVPAPEQPKQPELSKVKSDYDLVAQIGTKKAWEVFLDTYKTGFYANLAREQLAKLNRESGKAVASLEPTVPPASTKPTNDEIRAWNRIKTTTDKSALEKFISLYPNSPLALSAQHRLDILERAAREREEKANAKKQAETAHRNKQLSEADKKKLALACKREEERLDDLSSAGNSASVRDDLKRLQQDMICEDLRPRVVAAIDRVTAAVDKTGGQKPDTPALIASAQKELTRLGCYAGAHDGKLDAATKVAIKKYKVQKGEEVGDVSVTESFVSQLGKEKLRVCSTTVVDKPTPSHKRKEAQRERSKSKAKPQARQQSKYGNGVGF
jgi:Caspase domain